jgi:hypothetical protein
MTITAASPTLSLENVDLLFVGYFPFDLSNINPLKSYTLAIIALLEVRAQNLPPPQRNAQGRFSE